MAPVLVVRSPRRRAVMGAPVASVRDCSSARKWRTRSRILAHVRAAIARGGAHVDARASGAAIHADDDVVGEADHRRPVGRFEHAALRRLRGRRVGSRHLPLELAHDSPRPARRLHPPPGPGRRCAGRDRPSAAPGRSARPDRRPGWRRPVRTLASETKRGGAATSVVMSLMRGRFMRAGTKVSGQASISRGSRTPKAALPAPPMPAPPDLQRVRSARPASPGPSRPRPTAKRLTATWVGNEVSRCRTTPTTSRLAEKTANRLDQRASGATIIGDRSIMVSSVQSLRS